MTLTREEHLKAAYVALEQKMTDLAVFNAIMAVAAGQGEFLAAVDGMKNQGPPQVGGTRMMTCGNTIGQDACRGQVSEQLYTVVHQSNGYSSFMYTCCKCGHFMDVKRVATASLPANLRPPPKSGKSKK
jgi:hypothetical protein